jgi:hypothetical protein
MARLEEAKNFAPPYKDARQSYQYDPYCTEQSSSMRGYQCQPPYSQSGAQNFQSGDSGMIMRMPNGMLAQCIPVQMSPYGQQGYQQQH